MSKTPRNLPRFLPTLTEVVHPPGLTRTSVPPTPDTAEIAKAVMLQVELMIDQRLQEEADALVRTLVAESLEMLHQHLRKELELVVRQAVSDAITSLGQPQNATL